MDFSEKKPSRRSLKAGSEGILMVENVSRKMGAVKIDWILKMGKAFGGGVHKHCEGGRREMMAEVNYGRGKYLSVIWEFRKYIYMQKLT